MPRCLPNPNRPGFDRCGQRSAGTAGDGETCYYCQQALDRHLAALAWKAADWAAADFTTEERAATDRGYTIKERLAISGRQFGAYPQAISEEHARKLDASNRRFDEYLKTI